MISCTRSSLRGNSWQNSRRAKVLLHRLHHGSSRNPGGRLSNNVSTIRSSDYYSRYLSLTTHNELIPTVSQSPCEFWKLAKLSSCEGTAAIIGNNSSVGRKTAVATISPSRSRSRSSIGRQNDDARELARILLQGHHHHSSSNFHSYVASQIRAFSTGGQSSNDTDETTEHSNTSKNPTGRLIDPTSVVASTVEIPGAGKQRLKPMDADFASYLTGDMKQSVERKGKVVKRKRRFLSADPDKELYKQIRRMQTMKKEQSRLRTATNVYRALIGNVVICVAKLGAWLASGSSGMLAEFIHSVVDCGNQSLLLLGLRDSRMVADSNHPYGYGKSVYFWALVSALGTFFLGAGVSMTHAVGDLLHPSLVEITWHVWSVLAFSFAVDGYVLHKTIKEVMEDRPAGVSVYTHLSNIRDPATLAILLEDGAACLGVVLAFGGIAASHVTGNPVFDALAGVGISGLLGAMGMALVRMNHRFLLGQGVNKEITDEIERILLSRRSIDGIGSVQSQWTGPETFSFKAEVDFDGTYLAAKLMPIYQQEFLQIKDSMDDELKVLLALYAEDVMRTAEREVRHVEAHIRKQFPGAEYIELEPMSVDVDRLAIDDNLEAELRRVESDALNRYLKTLRKEEASEAAQTANKEASKDAKK